FAFSRNGQCQFRTRNPSTRRTSHMGFVHWFRTSKSTTIHNQDKKNKRRRGFRPHLELLEERVVLSSEFPSAGIITPNAVEGQMITNPIDDVAGNVPVFHFSV